MSDVIVHVLPGSVDERDGEFKNDQGETVKYSTRKQEARLEANGFAYPYSVRLEKDQRAWPVGAYRLAVEKMIQVNKGAHGFSKFAALEPIAAPVK